MGATVTADNGTQLPIDSLPISLAFSGGFISTMTTEYAGITYVQTFDNDGTNVTYISNWQAQTLPPGSFTMQTQSGGYQMITQDGNIMITGS